MSSDANQQLICGFWRRIVAFIIDVLLLMIIGMLLGKMFERQFVFLAGWAPLVGFTITVIYFGLTDSYIGRGQSPGKKLFHICVVGRNGQFISMARSMGRAGILAIPICLDSFHPSGLPYMIQSIIAIGENIINVGMIYFYLFNRNTRQSIHDLAIDTFVVKARNAKQPINNKVWRKHYAIMLAIGIIIIFTNLYMLNRQVINNKTMDNKADSSLSDLRNELIEQENVRGAEILTGQTMLFNKKTWGNTVNVIIFINDPNYRIHELQDQIKEMVLAKYPSASTIYQFQVKLIYGYDIGITKKYQTYTTSFSPEK